MEPGANRVTLHARLSLASDSYRPFLTADTTYQIVAGAGLTVTTKATVAEDAPELPRFGFQLLMTEDHENLTYFGRGPAESYADKRWASRMAKTLSITFARRKTWRIPTPSGFAFLRFRGTA